MQRSRETLHHPWVVATATMIMLGIFQVCSPHSKFKAVATLLLGVTTFYYGLYRRRSKRGIARNEERILIIGGSRYVYSIFNNNNNNHTH